MPPLEQNTEVLLPDGDWHEIDAGTEIVRIWADKTWGGTQQIVEFIEGGKATRCPETSILAARRPL